LVASDVLLQVSLDLVEVIALTQQFVLTAAQQHGSLQTLPASLVSSCCIVYGREDQLGLRRGKALVSNAKVITVLTSDDILLVLV
jgi:hypothetical protein